MNAKPEISEAIPADLAKAALRKDSSNLLKKVAAGKTLTKSEREILSKASERKEIPSPESIPKRAASMKAAASMLNFPMTWISMAKAAGCHGFNAKGSVLLKPVREWILENQTKLESVADQLPLREQKLAEEVRKLRLRNDREESELVKRAWVRERFNRYRGEIAAYRSKAESEHPVRLAEAGGDIALMRSAYRKTWDAIMRILQDASHHFAE